MEQDVKWPPEKIDVHVRRSQVWLHVNLTSAVFSTLSFELKDLQIFTSAGEEKCGNKQKSLAALAAVPFVSAELN